MTPHADDMDPWHPPPSFPRPLDDASEPQKVLLQLLDLSVRNLRLLIFVNLTVALLIGLVQITLGDPVEMALPAFVIACAASMIGGAMLLPFTIRGPDWAGLHPRLSQLLLYATEIAILAGVGLSTLFQTSPESYAINAHPLLGLGGAGAISAILAPRLPAAAWLGRLALFLPFAIWLIIVRPDFWWGMLAMSATCYVVSIVIAVRLYREALNAANVSVKLHEAHALTLDLAGRLRDALASEQEKAQRLALEARLMERFLHTVTHDLRQSLSAISLHTRAFRRDMTDSRADAYADSVIHALASSDEMIESVAQAAWLDHEGPPPTLHATALGPLLRSLAAEVRPVFRRAGIELRLVPTSLWVETAPNLLDRALRNLLHNAARHSGASRTLLGARRRGAHVDILVMDNGIGIAPENHGRIFERFHQGSDPAARPIGSVGLGLAIVRELAGRLRGQVRLLSVPGRYSCFQLSVPRGTPAGTERWEGTIVVIDDDPLSLEQLSAAVEATGGQAVRCGTLKDAMDRPAADFYICDFFLDNRLTALDFLAHLPAEASSRVLVVSGHLPATLAARLKETGCHYTPKPLSAAWLRTFLRDRARRL